MLLLRQLSSGTTNVLIGPVISNTDGVTPYTGALLYTDVKVSKNGAAKASKSETTAPTHDADGCYIVTLNSTDLGTPGHLRIEIVRSGNLPCWVEATVMATVAYDALVAGVDNLATDLTIDGVDSIFTRDISSIAGEASRSLLNAIRFLRNRWSVAGTTLTVYEEDDTTAAWTATLTTNPSADPITSSDPA